MLSVFQNINENKYVQKVNVKKQMRFVDSDCVSTFYIKIKEKSKTQLMHRSQ